MQFAERGDAPSAQQALQALQSAPGPAQPEIIRDLSSNPPNLGDADQRLQALFDALQQHIDTPDPERAKQQLHDVLAMPRYAGVGSGQGLLERIVTTVLNAIGRFLNFLGVGNLHLNIPLWVWFALAALAILVIILWPIRGGLDWRGRQARQARAAITANPSVDFFAEADRLAGSRDYGGAIRALTGGVAVRLSGERGWQQSPYTVRELFQRAKDPEALRSLLRSFEETSYGQRVPDVALYERAAEAARPYRGVAA
ncbi:MAG TPA: hypothetical protein VM674_00465 [Candidatus Acidoferrum sp.]|nr:hypothetical protein [Candidatus Acidoferrum sp.]